VPSIFPAQSDAIGNTSTPAPAHDSREGWQEFGAFAGQRGPADLEKAHDLLQAAFLNGEEADWSFPQLW
jgi:hypothetical protein